MAKALLNIQEQVGGDPRAQIKTGPIFRNKKDINSLCTVFNVEMFEENLSDRARTP